MGQRYNDKKAKAIRYSAVDLKNLYIWPENPEEGLRSRREHCWNYGVSVSQNTPQNLVVQGRASWSIVVT